MGVSHAITVEHKLRCPVPSHSIVRRFFKKLKGELAPDREAVGIRSPLSIKFGPCLACG